MKTVYFVRHGQSTINARLNPLCIPDHEAELTEQGREQSAFIAERAKSLPIETIISSPYVRTRDTAVLISKATGVSVEYSDLFVEKINPTSLVGRVFEAPETTDFFRGWMDTMFVEGEKVEDGENFSELKERGKKALAFLEARPETHILVVSHGFFLRMVMALVMFGDALTPREFRQIAGGVRTDNTGLTVLTKELTPHFDVDPELERWRIRVFNDHAHLG